MCKRVFLVTGIASFFCALFCSYMSLTAVAVVAAVALLSAVLCLVFYRIPLCRLALLVALSAFAVSMLWTLKLWITVYPQLAYDGCEAKVTVRVREVQAASDCFIVSTEEGSLGTGVNLCLWAEHIGTQVKEGDLLSGTVSIASSFERESPAHGKQNKASGVWLYAWPVEDSVMIWEDGTSSLSGIRRGIYALRDGIHSILYRYLSEDNAALCEGMLIGERDNMDEEQLEAFRDSGVYHVLAVSGMHLSVLAGAVLWLTKALRVPRRFRAMITMLLTVLFMALCGFTESIVRAGIMTLVALSSLLFRRRADGLNSLGLAVTFMLIADPFCIYSVGWQLSFAATLGLLIFFPVWERDITSRITKSMCAIAAYPVKGVLSAVGTALCASVMTCPVSSLYFGDFSVYFLPGNLIAVPLSTGILVLGMLGVLTGGWFSVLAKGLFAVIEFLCDILCEYIAWLTSLPLASVAIEHPAFYVWLFLLVGAVILGYVLWRMHGVIRMTALMMAALCVACAVQHAMLSDSVSITSAATDRTAIVVESAESCGVIFAGDEKDLETLSALLSKKRIESLEWVLWVRNSATATCPVQRMAVPIRRLLLTEERNTYNEVPSAEEIAVLCEGESLRFSENGTLHAIKGMYRLELGKTTILLVTGSGRLDALSADEQEVSLLLLGEWLPEDLSSVRSEHTVVFCGMNSINALSKTLPQSLKDVRYTSVDGESVWITRQKGDMTLRAY